jgi:hypothetical protein
MDAQPARSPSIDERAEPRVGTSPGAGLFVFLIAFTAVFYVLNAPLMLGHYDLGWHLAAGDLIRAQGHVPLHDPWSFTAGDRQWFNMSWLWDVIASMVFQLAGLSGLVLGVIACGAVIVGVLTSICLRSGASAAAVGIAVFLSGMLYPSFATPPNIYLAASANLATMLFAVLFYAACQRQARRFVLPAMMVLWVNMHGGFPLGLLIIGVFAGAATLRRDWAAVRQLCGAGAGCAVAVLVNPLGWHIRDGVAATLGHFVQAEITEWMSYADNFNMPGCLPGIAYILAFAALELRGRVAVPLEARLLSWLFLLLGIAQFRYLSLFFMFSAVPMALHFERLLPRRLSGRQLQRAMLGAGMVGLCVLPLAFLRVAPAFAFPDLLSAQDARYLQTHFPRARLLNHWNVGGLLIFYNRGAVPVFVDGRAATAYPDDLLRDYLSLPHWTIDEAAWDAVLAKYGIDTVLWVKDHDALRQFLVGRRGWTEAYAGTYESIYVKPAQ